MIQIANIFNKEESKWVLCGLSCVFCLFVCLSLIKRIGLCSEEVLIDQKQSVKLWEMSAVSALCLFTTVCLSPSSLEQRCKLVYVGLNLCQCHFIYCDLKKKLNCGKFKHKKESSLL